jgi:hypothetical protein
MDTKQFIELLILGENICASWLASDLDPELLEFAIDWDFNSSSDYFKIKKTALDLGLELGDSNVLKLVKAGCQGTLERERNGTRDELVGVDLYDRPATQEWPLPKWIDRGEKK